MTKSRMTNLSLKVLDLFSIYSSFLLHIRSKVRYRCSAIGFGTTLSEGSISLSRFPLPVPYRYPGPLIGFDSQSQPPRKQKPFPGA